MTATPEPEEWALLAVAAGLLLYLLRGLMVQGGEGTPAM